MMNVLSASGPSSGGAGFSNPKQFPEEQQELEEKEAATNVEYQD